MMVFKTGSSKTKWVHDVAVLRPTSTKIKHMGMTMRMMLGIVHREGAPPPD